MTNPKPQNIPYFTDCLECSEQVCMTDEYALEFGHTCEDCLIYNLIQNQEQGE